MYDHRYPTKTCGRSNPTVRSSWDNVTSPSGGWISREGIQRLPTPRRSGARVGGMANSGELLINVARSNKHRRKASPMGRRVEDEGASQCRSVVDRIEGESSHGQHPLTAKAG